ncbi:MAG: hypothetical protein ACK5JR_15065 [Tropicimonas sp.]|uniref:hypothetical protein n=1 Tax=Tropicimonas sp. TaxID=2067044 RepID=UPI003A88A86E
MENACQIFTRMSTVQRNLEQLRKDVSEELVIRKESGNDSGNQLPRFHELHGRLSTAIAALSGELRER